MRCFVVFVMRRLMMNPEIVVLFLLFVSMAVGFAVWFNSEGEE